MNALFISWTPLPNTPKTDFAVSAAVPISAPAAPAAVPPAILALTCVFTAKFVNAPRPFFFVVLLTAFRLVGLGPSCFPVASTDEAA